MSRLQPSFVTTVAALVLLLGAWLLLQPWTAFSERAGPRLYALAGLAGCLDLWDLVMRVYLRRRHTLTAAGERVSTSVPLEIGRFTPRQMRLHLKPYALVVSVYNAEEELDDFLEAMAPYRDRLWVVDDASSDDTCVRLEQAGVRCLRGSRNQKKPGALKQLMATLDPQIATVVVLDPDARILNTSSGPLSDLERVIFEFQRSRMAALCPRLAIRDEGLLGRLQALEYWMSFNLGRRSLRDHTITSGIAIYRRDALQRVLESHTLSVYAEDLKNAILLLAQGEGIYYDGRLVVETAGKRTWRSWFSQRVAWYFGFLKVYAESFDDLVRARPRSAFFKYHFLVYTGVFGLLFHPFRLFALGLLALSLAGGLDALLGLGLVPAVASADPTCFLFAYSLYTLLATIALFMAVERGERLRLLPGVPLYFFYAVLHTVPITVGYLNWFGVRLLGRRLYRDHFQEESALRQELCGQRR